MQTCDISVQKTPLEITEGVKADLIQCSIFSEIRFLHIGAMKQLFKKSREKVLLRKELWAIEKELPDAMFVTDLLLE